MSTTRLFTLVAFLFTIVPLAVSVSKSHMRHSPFETAHRHRTLEQRDADVMSPARLTYFVDGLGACGKTNGPDDFIVALNSAQYGSGGHCFETITLTVGEKTTEAQIVDECPGCPMFGLDLSQGLFQFFAPESVGVLTGSWVYGAGSDGSSAPSTNQSTPSSTTAPPPPLHTTTRHTLQPTITLATVQLLPSLSLPSLPTVSLPASVFFVPPVVSANSTSITANISSLTTTSSAENNSTNTRTSTAAIASASVVFDKIAPASAPPASAPASGSIMQLNLALGGLGGLTAGAALM